MSINIDNDKPRVELSESPNVQVLKLTHTGTLKSPEGHRFSSVVRCRNEREKNPKIVRVGPNDS